MPEQNIENKDIEEQINVYIQEKNTENLNRLIGMLRTRKVFVQARMDEQKRIIPCLLETSGKDRFFAVFTSPEHMSGQVQGTLENGQVITMDFLDANHAVAQQLGNITGLVINPFTQNLMFKDILIKRIEEVEEIRKNGGTVEMTPEQYFIFERKQFEFGYLPKRFFAQGKQMLDELCEKKEAFIDQFFEERYQQKRMYPYLEEEFSVMPMEIAEKITVVRVDLPERDMGIPSCYRVYLAWDNEKNKGRYFTIEQTGQEKNRSLGELTAELRHIDYGEAPVEGAELQRIADLLAEKA